jgi:hypothetical protein
MPKIKISLTIFLFMIALISCEFDEGKLPNIKFKTGDNYISRDTTLDASHDLLIGITASKSESNDVLKKFNISKSINGGTSESLFSQSLSGSDGNNYSYDYSTLVDTTKGQFAKYTFTVTNRDGLTNQVELTVTTKSN